MKREKKVFVNSKRAYQFLIKKYLFIEFSATDTDSEYKVRETGQYASGFSNSRILSIGIPPVEFQRIYDGVQLDFGGRLLIPSQYRV